LAPLGGATPEEFELFNAAHKAGHAGAKAFVGLSLIAQAVRHSDEETRAAQQEGWSLLQEAARSGDLWGQYLLAHALAEGFGIAQNRRLALTWANRAADHGLAQAQALLAYLLLPALGAPALSSSPAESANAEKGLVMLFCAARQGDWLAHYNLGVRLMKGEGIAKDSTAGLEWLERASEAGHLLASQALIQYR
jgi:TPR repeat protein